MSAVTFGSACSGKPYQPSAAALPSGMRVKAPTRDIAGQRFGRLTALHVTGKNKQNSLVWACRCDCGNAIDRASSGLRKAKGISSCGCYLKEVSKERLRNEKTWSKGTTYTLKDEFKNKKAWATAVIRERGNACEKCGWCAARCDVHHRVPKAVGGKNTIANGIVLCPNCHRIEHEQGRGD